MFSHAKQGKSRVITNVNTRSQTKYVFKTEAMISKKNEKSSCYLGTRLWNGLDKETQELDNI